jgi:sec-independent protein translocase protein TatA
MHSSGLLFISNLFSSDMLIIMVIALFLFGGEKLPEIARGLGKGIRDFKDASEGIKREINDHINSLEEKKTEEALNKKAEEIQNQLPDNNGHLIEGHPPVENTIAVNENHFTGNENTVADSHDAGAHTELVSENHEAGGKTNELIKNS